MRTLKTVMIGMIALAGITISHTAKAQPGFRANVNFSLFYNELSPHGRWVDMPRYGQVWIYRDPNFRPYYTNGYWMDSDLGWAWQSNYPWGWAPFHYGRWEFDPLYGWFWIPGYDYAPAWVAWSEADDYYGWAPLGFGVNINVSIGHIPANRWMYAQSRYMGHRRIDRYCIPYERNHIYYERQRPIVNINVYNNVRYDRGPRRPEYHANGYRPDYRGNGNRSREYNRPEYRGNGNGRGNGNSNGRGREFNNENRRFEERRNDNGPGNRGRGNPRNQFSETSPAPVNRNQAILESQRPTRNNNEALTRKKEMINRRSEQNTGRQPENPGLRQRIIKAELSR